MTAWNRRAFLRNSLLTLGGVALGGPSALAERLGGKPSMALRLTILHTNDLHSHLDPMDGGQYAGLGGAARRAGMVQRFRAENEHVLLLDCGDIFMGTPYFTLFEGEPELRSMNAMGYDAGTIGNHEFDAGMERLATCVRDIAEFPFLMANYDFRGTAMEGVTREFLVLERGGARIGLVGAGIEMAGLVRTALYGETKYLDPVAEVRRVARHLRHEERCDFIICLSHIGLRAPEGKPNDRVLAQEVPELDLILGGHNHILLNEPVAECSLATGRPVWINQVGWAGTHLGALQFDLYGPGQRELASGRSLEAVA